MIRIRTEACSLYSSSPKKFFEPFVFAGWASSSEYAFSVYIYISVITDLKKYLVTDCLSNNVARPVTAF